MDFKSHAKEINLFLTNYQMLWEEEVLDGYPKSLDKYKKSWVDELDKLTNLELHQFDSYLPMNQFTDTSFINFLDEIKKLTTIDSVLIKDEVQLEDWAYVDVKSKKRHEINRIAPIIKKVTQEKKINKVIDIGGGVGHLSRIIAHYYGVNTICIDRDPYFLERGKERINRYRKLPNSKDVEFLNITFGDPKDELKFKEIINENSFTVGLHTCGPLANNVINSSVDFKTNGLLSFGCCYHKLNAEKDFGISNFFKENLPLKLNLYAFTLASRAHCQIGLDEFETKMRVKNYRQGLHLFLYHKFDIKNCFDVGELHIREYQKPFSHYLQKKLEQLNLLHQYTLDDLENFYREPETQKTLRKMFLCNLIRWHLGRVLELYILLDRAIYLEEKGYDVSLKTYFEETISPRNLGILALREKLT